MCIIVNAGAGTPQEVKAFWHHQLEYLATSTHWLPTIGLPAKTQRILWTQITPEALSNGACLIILDKSQVVFALRFLQGCAEQHALDSSSKAKIPVCVLFGQTADLHQHLRTKSAASLCEKHGLHLVAGYSTSKPISKRYAIDPNTILHRQTCLLFPPCLL